MGLVVLALMPRGVARHERVVVLAVDGVGLGDVARRARGGGELPYLRELLATGVVREVETPVAGDDAFWHAVFTGVPRVERAGAATPRFWDALASEGALVLVHVPGVYPEQYPGAIVMPGADAARGFIGDNVGVETSYQRLVRADVDWPYSPVAARVAEAAGELERGAVSDWIDVEQAGDDGRTGRFRVQRLSDQAAYLSPVYRMAPVGSPELADIAGDYVADDPSWASASPRLGEYYFEHVRELARGRASAAAELGPRPWHLMVYYDSTLASVRYAAAQVDGPEARRAVDDAFADLDARIAQIVGAAGPGAAVVVIGRAAQRIGEVSADDDAADPGGGFFVLAPGGSRDDGPAQEAGRVEATLRYLAGLPASPARHEPIRAVRARFWRPSTPRLAAAPTARSRELPFTVESFDALGLLSDSTEAPDPADGDASVASESDLRH